MLCPRCASNQSDDVKFCTSCGANLQAVREALALRDPDKKFDWADTWLAEMFMSGEAAERRKLEIERRLGITPEVKRYNEIKAGVITSSVGIGVAIFLYFFMQGIATQVPPHDVPIITRIWVAGVIPFFIGLALILNGLVVSKKLVEVAEREKKRANELEGNLNSRSLRPGDTTQFVPANMSVTEQTTRHLQNTDLNR